MTWIGVALIALGLFFVILGGLTRTLHLPASPLLPADAIRPLGSPTALRDTIEDQRSDWPIDDGRSRA